MAGFVGLYFPRLAELIDWEVEPTWLETELGQIVRAPGRRNWDVDLLFKVRLLDGQFQWILCHVEIQSSFQPDFASRLDLYNSGLKWYYKQDVLTLVVLADLNPNWRPDEHHFRLAGFESLRRFPICKIVDRLKTDWADNKSLAVQVARAQIAALQTAGDPQARYAAKMQLVRNLYHVGHTADTIRELFRLIDRMMQLPAGLGQRFGAELITYEQEIEMPYVTSVERFAEERGIEKGVAKVVFRQLTRRFGTLSEDLVHQIHQLSIEQIESLGESLLDFTSLTDLSRWLDNTGR